MPTEAIHRLAAHTAESWTLHVCAFAIGDRWRSICGGQSMLVAIIAELPAPACGGPAPSSKRSRQPISSDRMGKPKRTHREPRRRRHGKGGRVPKPEPPAERSVVMPD